MHGHFLLLSTLLALALACVGIVGCVDPYESEHGRRTVPTASGAPRTTGELSAFSATAQAEADARALVWADELIADGGNAIDIPRAVLRGDASPQMTIDDALNAADTAIVGAVESQRIAFSNERRTTTMKLISTIRPSQSDDPVDVVEYVELAFTPDGRPLVAHLDGEPPLEVGETYAVLVTDEGGEYWAVRGHSYFVLDDGTLDPVSIVQDGNAMDGVNAEELLARVLS